MIEAITTELAPMVRAYTDGDEVAFPTAITIATASAP